MSDRLRPGITGFSLVELVFTLVILGILASLAAPSMLGWTRRTQMTAALNQLSQDINYARMLAVRQGQSIEIRFVPAAANTCIDQYQLIVLSSPAERIAKTNVLADEARGVCLTRDDANTLVFNSRGIPSRGMNFGAAYAGMTEALELSLGGRVRRAP